MHGDLAGRTVVVTGGTRGIGLETARQVAVALPSSTWAVRPRRTSQSLPVHREWPEDSLPTSATRSRSAPPWPQLRAGMIRWRWPNDSKWW